MSASSDTVTTVLAPPRSARARLRALAEALRDSIAGARQALDRMNRLIAAARLDHPDE
jgi:hypothetical protein